MRLSDLAARFGGTVLRGPDFELGGFRPLSSAGAADAAFLADASKVGLLADCRAGCVILPPAVADAAPASASSVWLIDQPYLAFARVSQLLEAQARGAKAPTTTIHPTAVVDASAVLGMQVWIGPHAVIGAGVRIGDRTHIGAGCTIGEQSCVGDDGLLHARVSIGPRVVVGARVVMQSGAVVGADGFGFAPDAQRHWVKIPQVGGVVLGDDVEVGANSCIDAGTLAPTRIGHGVKIDNLVQIAHNVQVGDHTAIAANVGIAGSTKIGSHCMLAGGAGINGHIEIVDNTVIGPMSSVHGSIKESGHYVGFFPIMTRKKFERAAVLVRTLPERLKQKLLPSSSE